MGNTPGISIDDSNLQDPLKPHGDRSAVPQSQAGSGRTRSRSVLSPGTGAHGRPSHSNRARARSVVVARGGKTRAPRQKSFDFSDADGILQAVSTHTPGGTKVLKRASSAEKAGSRALSHASRGISSHPRTSGLGSDGSATAATSSASDTPATEPKMLPELARFEAAQAKTDPKLRKEREARRRMEQRLHRSREELRSLDDVSKTLGRCTIQQVRLATDKAKASLGIDKDPPSILYARVNRRQFFELFAEQGEGDERLLGLPLSVFPVLDVERSGQIFLIHLLLALGLTADGPLRRKLEYCFELCDIDQSGELDGQEMADFLRVAVFVLHALGVLPENLSPEQLHYLTVDMFKKADTDQGGTVDHSEFFVWLQESMHTTVVLESIGRAAQLERKQRILRKQKKKLVWEKKSKKKKKSRKGASPARGGGLLNPRSTGASARGSSAAYSKGAREGGGELEMGTQYSATFSMDGPVGDGYGIGVHTPRRLGASAAGSGYDDGSSTSSGSESSDDENGRIEVPWRPSYPTTSFNRLPSLPGGGSGAKESKAIAAGRKALKKLEKLTAITRKQARKQKQYLSTVVAKAERDAAVRKAALERSMVSMQVATGIDSPSGALAKGIEAGLATPKVATSPKASRGGIIGLGGYLDSPKSGGGTRRGYSPVAGGAQFLLATPKISHRREGVQPHDDPLGLVRVNSEAGAAREAAQQAARRVEQHNFEDDKQSVPRLARPTSARFARAKSNRRLRHSSSQSRPQSANSKRSAATETTDRSPNARGGALVAKRACENSPSGQSMPPPLPTASSVRSSSSQGRKFGFEGVADSDYDQVTKLVALEPGSGNSRAASSQARQQKQATRGNYEHHERPSTEQSIDASPWATEHKASTSLADNPQEEVPAADVATTTGLVEVPSPSDQDDRPAPKAGRTVATRPKQREAALRRKIRAASARARSARRRGISRSGTGTQDSKTGQRKRPRTAQRFKVLGMHIGAAGRAQTAARRLHHSRDLERTSGPYAGRATAQANLSTRDPVVIAAGAVRRVRNASKRPDTAPASRSVSAHALPPMPDPASRLAASVRQGQSFSRAMLESAGGQQRTGRPRQRDGVVWQTEYEAGKAREAGITEAGTASPWSHGDPHQLRRQKEARARAQALMEYGAARGSRRPGSPHFTGGLMRQRPASGRPHTAGNGRPPYFDRSNVVLGDVRPMQRVLPRDRRRQLSLLRLGRPATRQQHDSHRDESFASASARGARKNPFEASDGRRRPESGVAPSRRRATRSSRQIHSWGESSGGTTSIVRRVGETKTADVSRGLAGRTSHALLGELDGGLSSIENAADATTGRARGSAGQQERQRYQALDPVGSDRGRHRGERDPSAWPPTGRSRLQQAHGKPSISDTDLGWGWADGIGSPLR